MAIINPATLGSTLSVRAPRTRPLWVPIASTLLAADAIVNVAASMVLLLGYSTWDGKVVPLTLGVGLLDALIAVVCAVGAVELWRASRFWRATVVVFCAFDLFVGLLAAVLSGFPSRGTELWPLDALVLALLLLPPSSRAFFRRP